MMLHKPHLHIDLKEKQVDVIGDRALMRQVYVDLVDILREPVVGEQKVECGFRTEAVADRKMERND